MKIHDEEKGGRIILDSLSKQSLRNAAQTVKSIRKQRISQDGGNKTLELALKHSEEAMYHLAADAGQEEERIEQILRKHDLADLM